MAIAVELPDEHAEVLVRAATGAADELLDGAAVRVAVGVMLGEQRCERVAGERTRLTLVEDDELRVNREVVEVLTDKTQAEAVQCGNLRGVEEGKLLGEAVGGSSRCLLQLVLQCLP